METRCVHLIADKHKRSPIHPTVNNYPIHTRHAHSYHHRALTVYFQVGAVLQTAQQKPGSLTWMAAITSGWFR
jgi:hypothetical protein